MSTDLATVEKKEIEMKPEIATLQYRMSILHDLLKNTLRENQDFGVIPGTGGKKTLLKPGAEKIATALGFRPRNVKNDVIEMGHGHREYQMTVEIFSNGGDYLGFGVGSCSTMESKYRYRAIGRTCPMCHREGTIIKGKREYGGGWICYEKKGGCGEKFPDGARAIEEQASQKTENPDIADVYNTVLKMAKKRALIDAVLTVTAASDTFTQDLDDNLPDEDEAPPATNHSTNGNGKPSSTESKLVTHSKSQTGSIQFFQEGEILGKGGRDYWFGIDTESKKKSVPEGFWVKKVGSEYVVVRK